MNYYITEHDSVNTETMLINTTYVIRDSKGYSVDYCENDKAQAEELLRRYEDGANV